MEYRKLGNTDIDVSVICLGTMTWGEQNTFEEGYEQMNYAVDQGVNFFDTAELYPILQSQILREELRNALVSGLKKQVKEKKLFLLQK